MSRRLASLAFMVVALSACHGQRDGINNWWHDWCARHTDCQPNDGQPMDVPPAQAPATR